MGLCILEPTDTSGISVPGTIPLDTQVDLGIVAENLKRHPSKPDVILQPQPSDSPDDPLNWSALKKELFFFSLALSTMVVGVIGPIIVPSPPQIIATFPTTTVAGFTALVGYLVLTYGISSYLAVCLSECFGRRPACLISHVLLLWGIIWGAFAQSYAQLLGARIIQGFGMGVVGCIGTSFITDVFYVHEQGVRLALWQFSFNATICFTPILAGIINENLGWRYLFKLLLPFEGLAIIVFLLFQPESLYDRRFRLDVDEPQSTTTSPLDGAAGSKAEKVVLSAAPADLAFQEADVSPSPSTRSRFHQYRLWGTVSTPVSLRSVAMLLLRPMLLLLSPGVIYATLLYTFTFSWFVLLACIYSAVYSIPPYNLNSASVGYLCGAAPLVGVLVALLTSGPILDRGAQWLAKRNGGIFEPEFRLILNLPMFICFTIGAFGWGYSMSAGKDLIVTGVFLAFLNAGAAYGTIGSISYAVSLYPARGGATFGIIMLIKAIYAWSATLYIADWLMSSGIFIWTCTLVAVTLSLILLGIPFYVYGKRMRAWLARYRGLDWIFLDP